MSTLNKFLEKYPFMTLARYGDSEYIGIIQNQDQNLVSMYVYNDLKSSEHKRLFIEYGSEWWWETNRMIPINIVLGKRFNCLRYCLKTFNAKEFKIEYGPTVSLKNISKRRIKRKNIQLIRKVD